MKPSSFVVIVNCQSEPLPFADKNHDPEKTATLRFDQTHLYLQGYYECRSFSNAVPVNETIPLEELQDVVFFVYGENEPWGIQFTHIREGMPQKTFYLVPQNPDELENIADVLPMREFIESDYDEDNQNASQQQEDDAQENVLEQEQKAAEFMKKTSDAVRVPFVTILLFMACMVIFIMMICFADSSTTWTNLYDRLTNFDFLSRLLDRHGELSNETLVNYGADYSRLTLSNQPWRMITCSFVHINFMHIIFNMIFLLAAGITAERFFGHFSFALIYIGSAITGSMLSLYINPNLVSCGASGAVFGIYGSLIAYGIVNSASLPKNIYAECIWGTFYFIIYNLIYGFISAGIDNAAHIGGGLGGFLFGLAASIHSPNDIFPVRGFAPKRVLFLTVLVLSVCSLGFLGLKNNSKDAKWYAEIDYYSKEVKQILDLWNTEINKMNEKNISQKEFAQNLEQTILPRFLKLQSMESRLKNQKLDETEREALTKQFMIDEYRIRIIKNEIEGRKTDNLRAIQEGEYLIAFLNDCIESKESVVPRNNENNMNNYLDFYCIMADRESGLNDQWNYLQEKLLQGMISNETFAAKIEEYLLPEWEKIYSAGTLVDRNSLCKQYQIMFGRLFTIIELNIDICKNRLLYFQTGINAYGCIELLFRHKQNQLIAPESVPQTPEYAMTIQALTWYVDLFHAEQELHQEWQKACQEQQKTDNKPLPILNNPFMDYGDSALRHLEYVTLNTWRNLEKDFNTLELSLLNEDLKNECIERKAFIAQMIIRIKQGVEALKNNDKSAMDAVGKSIEKKLATELERMKDF